MTDDDRSDQPLGFSFDIGQILRDATKPRRTTRRRTTSSSRSSGGVDDAVRRVVRAELDDVEKAIRDLAEEVVRLRRANAALEERVAKLARR